MADRLEREIKEGKRKSWPDDVPKGPIDLRYIIASIALFVIVMGLLTSLTTPKEKKYVKIKMPPDYLHYNVE